MTEFYKHLSEICIVTAEDFRKTVRSKEEVRRYREMRAEFQFAAEIYHRLRESGYGIKDIFMNYTYPEEIPSQSRRLRPDLIFESNGKDEVVEFRIFWDGHLFETSELKKHTRNIVDEYYEKMKLYRKLPGNKIKSLTLAFAYLGPIKLSDKAKFDLNSYSKSIQSEIEEKFSEDLSEKHKIEVISC